MPGVKGQRSGGHNAKPTLKLRREGNYRADRHADRIDSKYEGVPAAPRGLGRDGRWLWSEITSATPAGVLVRVDSAMLFALCRWWQIWRRLDRKLGTDPNREVMRQASAAFKQFETLAVQFGLSPTSRARLKAPELKDGTADPWAATIAARNG